MRHQPLTLAVTLATMAATVFLYVKIPKGFFPQQDTGRLTGQILADQNTSFQAMDQRLQTFVEIMMKDPGVSYVQAYAGGGSVTNQARMFVTLKDPDERKLSADAIVARLRPQLAKVPGATLYLQSVQDLRIGGRPSAAQYQYTLRGEDVRELEDWAPKVLERMRKIPGLVDVNSDQQIKGLEASLTIDRATASRLGVTPAAIDETLYDAFGQRQVSTMYTSLNQYHVVLEMDPKFLQGPQGLDVLRVRSSDGTLIPLSAFARYAALDGAPPGQPPEPVPRGHDLLQPAARRLARRRGRKGRSRRDRAGPSRRRSAAASRAPRRRSRTRWRTSRS